MLKALLCAPGRQMHRSTLIDQVWPTAESEKASRDMSVALSCLRKILCVAAKPESVLITEGNVAGVSLAGQPVLWVDTDAAAALLDEAERQGRMSPAALPLLEEAGALFQQGTFLQDEEGQWAAGRRATVEQTRYRCRLWLAEACERQGMPG